MTSRLQRCRVVWGTTDRIAALPRLARVEEAVYRPMGPDGAWGLFGRDGGVIEAGVAAGSPAARTEALADAPDVPYLYIGPLVTHYGHFLLGTAARLWPLLTWEGPPPRLVGHDLGEPGTDWRALDVLPAILARFGLDIGAVTTFAQPTRLRRVLVPQAAFREQACAHDVYGEFARFVGRPFWDEADTVARPVYLSKARLTTGISRMRNEDALCKALARRGVDVVYPEALSLPALVRLISERRIVLGTTGSAFHTAVFAAPGRRIVGLNWAPHVNANFPLIDGVNGTTARYYHPAGSRSGPDAGFHFGWSVPDPEAVAAELLWRAERFDDLDAIDAAQEAGQRRAARGPVWTRLGRWLSRRV